MDKKISMARPTSLYINAALAAIIAILIVYVNFLDDYLHSIRIVVMYVFLFAMIITVASAFKKGQKELVKAGTATILTLTLFFHWQAFSDMVQLNYYYFFTGNILVTTCGIIAMVSFILFLIVFINHFRINASNLSNDYLVNINKNLLTFIAIICAIEALLIIYIDNLTGRSMELHLIFTYIMHVFICFVVINVEVMINVFRTAREMGILNKVIKERVGVKAAKTSNPKAVKTKKAKARGKKFKKALANTKI